MQIPPNLPKPAAPPPQDLKPEPVARVAPVVMNDAAARIDPSVILKTPVPVSQGPRTTHQVRSSTDQTGTVYTAPEIPDDPEAAAHIAKLTMQLGKVESGEHSLKWPMPREVVQQQSRDPGNQSLASTPKEALAMLKKGLDQSAMMAVAHFGEAIGLVKEKSPRNASTAVQSIPARGSQEVQDGLNLLMHGQLVWHGELTPGVRAKVYREDTYGEDPKNPGAGLVKGAQISIEAELPTIGLVTIRGMQIADSVSVVVRPETQGQQVMAQHFQELKEHLVSAHLEAVKIRLQSEDGSALA